MNQMAFSPLVLRKKRSDIPSPSKSVRRRDAGGGGGGVTVTVAVLLFVEPHAFETRTQYEVVFVGLTVREEPVAPEIGLEVLPVVPMYH
jgi:hypothetical protein